MKKLIFIVFLFISLMSYGQITTVHNSQVKIKDIPLFTITDSIMVMDADGLLRYRPISTLPYISGGTIGGSIIENQIATGASTANEIEGNTDLTWDGTTLNVDGIINIGDAGLSGQSGEIKINKIGSIPEYFLIDWNGSNIDFQIGSAQIRTFNFLEYVEGLDPVTAQGFVTVAYGDANYEDDLGTPPFDGYILSSLTNGTRSWVINSGGGDVTLAGDNYYTGENNFLNGNLVISETPDWIAIGASGRATINGISVMSWGSDGAGMKYQTFSHYNSGTGTLNFSNGIYDDIHFSDMASLSLPDITGIDDGWSTTIIQYGTTPQTFSSPFGDTINTPAGFDPTTKGQNYAITVIAHDGEYYIIGAMAETP